MRSHRIALLAGDGIGSDVINAGRRVLDALAAADGGFGFSLESFDWGSDRYRRTGRMMPEDGSGFDLIGKGIANPIGAFWSAALMLEHLGEAAAAGTLMRAIERVTEEGRVLPPDLGGTARTDEVTEAVIGIIARQNDARAQGRANALT